MKYFTLWEMDMSRMSADPKEMADQMTKAIEMTKQWLKNHPGSLQDSVQLGLVGEPPAPKPRAPATSAAPTSALRLSPISKPIKKESLRIGKIYHFSKLKTIGTFLEYLEDSSS